MLRAVQTRVREDFTESSALFCKIDSLRAGTDDRQACFGKILSQLEWCLSTELDDDAGNRSCLLLGIVDLQDVFKRQRLEVETIGGVVVGGYGLGVAVDHDRFIASGRDRHSCVHT